MKNYTKIMEIFWLIVAIGSSILTVKTFFDKGFVQESYMYLFPPFIAFGMWYVRRRYRKRVEENK